ncbi:VOC family protein [Thermomicrobiaceae bacterium CFH 74404]|uniref:VOC family protein n=1 Tax=Thermalbibacter longus TaxID=2951981 RepID=A0AA41WIX7_9BACT|nr:VOC family protein [Thermalbibacter longus]MCM8750216.1 VOC family protein [Thermalbibacter longus]
MSLGVRSVGIYMGDQDRAKEFWTQVMGFDLLQDTPMGSGPDAPRWIEVAPPDRRVILVLYTPEDQRDRIGTFSNVLFECDDIQWAYQELVARGVEFPDPPRQEFWGWWAMFRDPDGNTYGLGQRGE